MAAGVLISGCMTSWTEADRIAALHGLDVLDTPADAPFEEAVAAVRAICRTPIALVSLVDSERQWFKARSGVEVAETPLDTSVCTLVVQSGEVVMIPDLAADPRTAGMSLVTQPPHIRFYAGAPLTTKAGLPLGSLCAIDTVPRPEGLTPPEVAALRAMAQHVASQLELHGALGQRDAEERRRDALLRLGDAQRAAHTVVALADAAHHVIADTIGGTRVGYGRVDLQAETVTAEHALLAPGAKPWPEVVRFREFGSFIEELTAGRDVVIGDVLADPRTALHGEAMAALDVRALVNLPVVENGALVALLFVNDSRPRAWTRPELAFLREVLDRTRSAVERMRAEDALRELNATLEERIAARTAELMAAEEQLRQSQKMEAIGQLTGGVAHDFNNLLTVIRNSADLLRTRDLPEARRRRYVDAIASTADRAAKLTSQLLAFSRRQSLKPEVFEAGARVRGIADMLRSLLGGRVELSVTDCDVPCFVEADAGQFETAVVNMTVNARDAMEGEGRLSVRVGVEHALPAVRGHAGAAGEFVGIEVADTGGGIAPDVLERIFEPFFTTKEVGKGTGLGLSQVFGFAKQSGGEVDVRNDDGRGAVFTLYLPQVPAPLVQPAAAPIVVRASSGVGGKGRILLVEDNLEVGEFAGQLLEDLGYRPTLATNAAAALVLLESGREGFDVVFSDVVMPGVSGVELGRRIRAHWPDLPVVLTSGYSHVLAEDVRHGFDLLRKPYSVEELSGVLRRAMTQAAATG